MAFEKEFGEQTERVSNHIQSQYAAVFKMEVRKTWTMI